MSFLLHQIWYVNVKRDPSRTVLLSSLEWLDGWPESIYSPLGPIASCWSPSWIMFWGTSGRVRSCSSSGFPQEEAVARSAADFAPNSTRKKHFHPKKAIIIYRQFKVNSNRSTSKWRLIREPQVNYWLFLVLRPKWKEIECDKWVTLNRATFTDAGCYPLLINVLRA